MGTYTLDLGNEEGKEVLSDILDAWLEPFEDATKDVERDRSLASPEEMLSAMDAMHRQFVLVAGLREKLRLMGN